MKEKQKPILPSSKEWKEALADIQGLKKNKAEQFKEEWMDGQEVMFALHIGYRTLQTLRCTGQIPCSRVHHKIYYKTSDVKAMLESNYSIPPSNQKS